MAWTRTRRLGAACAALAALSFPGVAGAAPGGEGRGGLVAAAADLQARRYGRAEAELAGIVAAYPGSLEAAFYLGQALYYQGRLGEAKARFEAVRAADAGIPVTYYYLGRIAFDQGDYADALAQLGLADQKDPDLPMAHYYLGLVYGRQRKPGKALSEFKKALALQPDLGLAAYAESYILFHSFKKNREALACLKGLHGGDAGLRRKVSALRQALSEAP